MRKKVYLSTIVTLCVMSLFNIVLAVDDDDDDNTKEGMKCRLWQCNSVQINNCKKTLGWCHGSCYRSGATTSLSMCVCSEGSTCTRITDYNCGSLRTAPCKGGFFKCYCGTFSSGIGVFKVSQC